MANNARQGIDTETLRRGTVFYLDYKKCTINYNLLKVQLCCCPSNVILQLLSAVLTYCQSEQVSLLEVENFFTPGQSPGKSATQPALMEPAGLLIR